MLALQVSLAHKVGYTPKMLRHVVNDQPTSSIVFDFMGKALKTIMTIIRPDNEKGG